MRRTLSIDVRATSYNEPNAFLEEWAKALKTYVSKRERKRDKRFRKLEKRE